MIGIVEKDLTEDELRRVGKIKALALACEEMIDELFEGGYDAESANFAKKELQTGFMWAVRAITHQKRIKDNE